MVLVLSKVSSVRAAAAVSAAISSARAASSSASAGVRPPGSGQEPDEQADQHDVEHRVGRRHRGRQIGVLRILQDRPGQQHPRQESEPDGHGRAVQQPPDVSAGSPTSDQQEEPGRDHRIGEQIEHVSGGGEPLDPQHVGLEAGRCVAAGHQQQPDRHQVPRGGPVGAVQPDTGHDRGRAGQPEAQIDRVLDEIGGGELGTRPSGPHRRRGRSARSECEPHPY